MTPSARLAAAIDLLTEIDEALKHRRAAADQLIRRYFQQRRYAGSSDRAAITDHVYGVIRMRGDYGWRLMSAGLTIDPRTLALLYLRLRLPADQPCLLICFWATMPSRPQARTRPPGFCGHRLWKRRHWMPGSMCRPGWRSG
ncbi:hypothetical protein [Iodidimonas nitroreducens]|uniref:hypothetical protein n=1 Tax=Iodidimonas nitroreducens TaxID=1236968 RepID=UPI0028D8CB67|nr:hypothetical protein [Iodidimonas nitroreducens]